MNPSRVSAVSESVESAPSKEWEFAGDVSTGVGIGNAHLLAYACMQLEY
jgi:hypothetical protein